MEEQNSLRRKIALTGTPRDRELENAQKEIQRRLLRQEKLKRIEAEEMHRLVATGWKQPFERTTPTAGPTVQDAADAIEETERWRSANGQEAQQRAEARQNDPPTTRDDSEVPRPAQVIAPRVDPFTLEPNQPARLEKSLATGRFIVIATVRGVPTPQHRISPDSRTNVTVAANVDRRQQNGEVIEDVLGMDNVVVGEGVRFEVQADGYFHTVEIAILNASTFKVKIEIEIREEKRI